MSLKKSVFLFCLFWLPLLSYAQQEFTVNGILFIKNSSERVSQATITNLRTKVIMMSDELGGFNISVQKGDTLFFNKNGFMQLKQAVNGPGDIAVYLQQIINLSEVAITGQTKKQELNEVMSQYRSQGTFFDGKPPVWNFLNSPLTGFYELFGKLPNEARRFKIYSKEELEQVEIGKRYNITLVKKVTKLNDEEAQKFMQSYTPSYEDVKGWNDYELISHIKRYFAFYQKNKDTVKLPKLPELTPP